MKTDDADSTRIPRYQPTEPSRWARLNFGPWTTFGIGVVLLVAVGALWVWAVGGVR